MPGTSAQGSVDTDSKGDSDVVLLVFPVMPAVVLAMIVTTNPLQSCPKLDLLDTLVTFLRIPKLPLVTFSNAVTSSKE